MRIGNTNMSPISFRSVPLRLRSRIIIALMRLFLRPWLARLLESNAKNIARTQLRILGMKCPDSAGLSLSYQVMGTIPGHVVGTLGEIESPFILWLHGGAFVLPASPIAHLPLVSRLCRDLGANGFLPDYRLAPSHRFPAGLDDCERAYRELLQRGHSPSRLILGGDSAGGTLLLALLNRIKKAGLPMPSCAIAVSPLTDIARVGGPPSRSALMSKDPILPVDLLLRIDELYSAGQDRSNPELSPLFSDCKGLPPLFLLATDREVLMDDSVLFAQRAHEAGANVRCDIWRDLPHAFVLFEQLFPEVQSARADMVAFIREHAR
jgi:acetyl esterase/lipase